jgi:threonine dehydrogenase-like Zn-dependent dehydrogenase
MDGVDYVFEAAGREQTVQQAWSSLDVGARSVLVLG